MVLPAVGSLGVGATLGAARGLGDGPFFLCGNVGAWQATVDRTGGSVTTRQLTLDLGAGWRNDAFDVAAGARVGWASLQGETSGTGFLGSSVSGVTAGPELAASVALAGPLRAWLRSGWLLAQVHGSVADEHDVTVGGFHASLGLGLRVGQ